MKKLHEKGFSAVEAMLLLVIVSLVGFVGWYVWQKQSTQKHDLGSSQSANIEPAKSNTDSGNTGSQEVHDIGTIIYRDDGVVVYFPDGFIDKNDKNELITKLINPMISYAPDVYISVTVHANLPQTYKDGASDDRYIVATIGKENKGGTGSFLFGSKKYGINWWTPTCLDECSFTQTYRNTYPEVVKLSESQ